MQEHEVAYAAVKGVRKELELESTVFLGSRLASTLTLAGVRAYFVEAEKTKGLTSSPTTP